MEHDSELPAIANVAIESTKRRFSADDVLDKLNEIESLIRRAMKEGVHYGTIPGTNSKSLFQPGAQLLSQMFCLRPSYTYTQVDLPDEHREFQMTCHLTAPNGEMVAEGVGSCSTRESKYRWRWQSGEKIPNPNLADAYNTVKKMAAKRAFVAATISATACAGIFSQDIEDIVENDTMVGAETIPGTVGPAKAAQVVREVRSGDSWEYALPYKHPEIDMEGVRASIKQNKQGMFDKASKRWVLRVERADLAEWLVKKPAKEESKADPLADSVPPWHEEDDGLPNI